MPGTTLSAVDAPNRFAEINGRRLAYRSIGEGRPVVLCTRFRGTMDVWDPAFLDALAANDLEAIIFDYSGLGQSSGEKNMNPLVMAQDARDLIQALELKDVVIAGWSLGGFVAQVVLALYPQHVSHAVLIATGPPGPYVKLAEQLFYDTASMPTYGLEEEIILFFEPRSATIREAARRSVERIAQRREGRSPPVPVDWAVANLGKQPKAAPFPADAVLRALEHTTIPVLHIGGDHDIVFPIENWYALNPRLPTLQLLTFPRAGHGPQHEHPEACAEHIASFVRHTPPTATAA